MRNLKYVCIHGHFYQPPRVSPFTGDTELDPSAAPYHDWNERITAECYGPCANAPILDGTGNPIKRLNLYESMSFDFGPTLLSWLETNSTETYRSIVAADRASVVRFGGHGSAMAHSFHHVILPLANHRDRVTEIRWGLADFIHRFGRKPEGFWLPETAVDTETLRILADQGILFTVLSPYQAVGDPDSRVPHSIDVGDGKKMAVFFYDGPLSQEIAFNGLLDDGHVYASRLLAATGEANGRPLLASVATDGESYGHHHRFGEMALAAAIDEIESQGAAILTNYGQFLALHGEPIPTRIVEGSSWSCSHGLGRWRTDCGCTTGAHPEWNQMWRVGLRAALNWLRDSIALEFARVGRTVLTDPWSARDAYVDVVLGGDPAAFLGEHWQGRLNDEEADLALGLLEIQSRSLMMFTSCGWFFDDITRIEVRIILAHAAKAIELSKELLGTDHEPGFLDILETARSNEPGITGRDVYQSLVSAYRGR